MRYLVVFVSCLLMISCADKKEFSPFSSVEIETLYMDTLSIRAIELMDGSLAFAANKGIYGIMDLKTEVVKTNVQKYDTILPEYRSVGHTATDFFMLSVANPALLYKTGENGKMELVYKEESETVFYDAMQFWNNSEGIAIGDSMDGCLSVIITRDGGKSWKKLSCEQLPNGIEGEGAFAASNTNIVVKGSETWVATTTGRIYFSPDKGKTWKIYTTPVVDGGEAHGIYSIDFYDENIGFAIGGSYVTPEGNLKNKALTLDGGKTWNLVANGQNPNYKSCVQFVPNGNGNHLVALGFTGISYSANQGNTWKQLSDEGFYTIRFLNDSTAYAAGKNRIAKLRFKKNGKRE